MSDGGVRGKPRRQVGMGQRVEIASFQARRTRAITLPFWRLGRNFPHQHRAGESALPKDHFVLYRRTPWNTLVYCCASTNEAHRLDGVVRVLLRCLQYLALFSYALVSLNVYGKGQLALGSRRVVVLTISKYRVPERDGQATITVCVRERCWSQDEEPLLLR